MLREILTLRGCNELPSWATLRGPLQQGNRGDMGRCEARPVGSGAEADKKSRRAGAVKSAAIGPRLLFVYKIHQVWPLVFEPGLGCGSLISPRPRFMGYLGGLCSDDAASANSLKESIFWSRSSSLLTTRLPSLADALKTCWMAVRPAV